MTGPEVEVTHHLSVNLKDFIQQEEREQMSEESVLISKEDYQFLREDSLMLECLQNNGVDNWEGWDEAVREFNERKEELYD